VVFDDPIFLTYLKLVGALLALAGGLLALLSYGMGRNVSSIWVTYRGWLIMIPLVMLTVGLGRVATIVGVTVLGCSASESSRARPGSTPIGG